MPNIDDERYVQRAHFAYAQALDTRDWSVLDHVIAEHCEAQYGNDQPLRGRSKMIAGIRRYLDHCGPTQHMIGNIVVANSADGLISHALVRAIHRGLEDERIFVSIARYSGRWISTPQGWRACFWRMDVDFNYGDPEVLGLPAQ